MVFINRYYFPDQSATSRVLTALAVELASRGYPVTVLTSDQQYEDPAARLAGQEQCDGVTVRRLKTSRFGRQHLPGRAVDYLAFIVGANWWLLRGLQRGDIVVCKTDPPMLSAFLWPVLKLRRAVLVNWLQDLFPEVAVQLGLLGRRLAAVAGWMRNAGLRAARRNVVIGRRMADKLDQLGLPREQQRLIENACDVEKLSAHQHGRQQRLAFGVAESDFLVMYSGNLGRAHPFEPLAEVIGQLSGHGGIKFVMIGGGAGMLKLRQRCEGLSNCQFLPYQPESLLAESLAAADLHLVALHPQLEGLIVPSKFYPIAAVGRPALYLGNVDSDVGHYLSQYQCGQVVSDASDLKHSIVELAGDPGRAKAMGENARALAQRQFSVNHSCDQWEQLLNELALYSNQQQATT